MKLLLDTCVYIYLVSNTKRIPKKILAQISDHENQLFVSQVSLIEIGFKVDAEKLTFSLTDFFNSLSDLNANFLTITPEHLDSQSKLEKFHCDPFDRLLVAQAQSNKSCLISNDEIFKKYKVDLLMI
jgi:PIN domain nuclease of toxin-antitoxin system